MFKKHYKNVFCSPYKSFKFNGIQNTSWLKIVSKKQT